MGAYPALPARSGRTVCGRGVGGYMDAVFELAELTGDCLE